MKKQFLILGLLLIISISFLYQDSYASILSASTKNVSGSPDLLTLNNTAGTHLFWVNNSGKLFAASNADFHSSTSVFDSGNFCIRNPASTFTTCITNSAVAANRTLTWPLITGTDTIATLGLAQTFTNQISINTTNNPILKQIGGSTAIMTLDSNSGTSGAQIISKLQADGLNAVSTEKTFDDIYFASIGVTPGAESGQIMLQTMVGGTITNMMSIDGNVPGITLYKALSANSQRIYLDNAGNNYWVMSSANVNDFYAGGTNVLTLQSSSPYFQFKEGTTGAVTATLGSNAPAGVGTTPYTWIKVRSADGSTVYIPAFK